MAEHGAPYEERQGVAVGIVPPAERRLTPDQRQQPDQQRRYQGQQQNQQDFGLGIRHDRINRLDLEVMVIATVVGTGRRLMLMHIRTMRHHDIVMRTMPLADHGMPGKPAQQLGQCQSVLGQQIGQKDQGNQQLGMCATHGAGHYHNPTQRLCKSL